uniref:Uncharacterized protein n=1 Tax=Rhizophora mucronata TaxID=61149 RepID=A0A2P2PZ12_RHIMU
MSLLERFISDLVSFMLATNLLQPSLLYPRLRLAMTNPMFGWI